MTDEIATAARSFLHKIKTVIFGRNRLHMNNLNPCPKCGDLDMCEEGASGGMAGVYVRCHRCAHTYFG